MRPLSDFNFLIATEVPSCPALMIERATLRAAIRFSENLMLVRDRTVNTVIGDRTAAITLASASESISQLLKATGGDGREIVLGNRLHAMEQARWATSGKPLAAWLEGTTLVFDSLPDAIEAVAISVTVKPARAATEVQDFLFEDWADGIAAGSKWFLMQVPGQPWSNPQLAGYYQGEFMNAIDRARIKQATGGTNADLRVKRRVFGQ